MSFSGRLMDQLSVLLRAPGLRSVATLVGGQGIAAVIPILTAPVLGRLYTPHEYGLLGAYMSIAVMITTIGNWQYAQAIVLEARDARAWALVRVCIWTTLVTAVISILVPVTAGWLKLEPGDLADVRPWLWLVPVSVVLGGLSATMASLANRFTRYRDLAKIQIATACATAATAILLGWYGWGMAGLFIGYLAGQIVPFVAFGRIYRDLVRTAPQTSAAASGALMIRHRNYPIYTMPTTFIEQFAANAPVFALTYAGAPSVVGLLGRARQLIAMPLGLVSASVTQVFQQRAASDVARQGHCREIFIKTFFALAGIGIVPAIVLAIAAPALFEFYLGANWRPAGDVARILAPMLYLGLVCSPLSRVFYIRNRQRLDLALSLSSAALVVVFTGVAVLLAWPPLAIVGAYASAASVVYIVYLVFSWQLAQPGAGLP